jgi:acyl-CoA thioesterase-1
MMGSDMNDVEVLGSGLARGTPIGSAPTRRRWLAHCTALAALASCTRGVPAWAMEHAKPSTRSILVVGDSLSAEYGLTRGTGWVALLAARLAQRRNTFTVINASISGDTTSGGRSRLPQLLTQHHPGIVILELGGNDALRGLPLDMTRSNLTAMARAAKAAGARVVMVGMQVPPNYGRQYGAEFAGLFGVVAKNEGTALVPFLLEGVADGPHAESLFQSDRIHPKEEAHPVMLDNVWPVLEPLLR